MSDANIVKNQKRSPDTTNKAKIKTNGLLAFTFGFLGISIVGLSSYLKDFQLDKFDWFYFSQLLIFHIFLFRYLLGNLSYLFSVASKGIDTSKIIFFLTWLFIIIQFIFIIIMGLSVNSKFFLYAFTLLIVSELLWSLFHVSKNFTRLENYSRILMLFIAGILIFLINKEEISQINIPWTLFLYVLIILDCINDLLKNKENYFNILKT